MPTFAYEAVDTAGKKRNGFIEAATEKAAIDLVRADGRHVLKINETQGTSEKKTTHDGEKKKARSNRSDLALFTRRFADLADAGLPLDRVLQVLAEQSETVPLANAAAECLEEVRGGTSVSDAMAMHPKLFPAVYTQTLKAGEASGQLPDSATRLADLLENEVARRSQITSALVYPAVLTLTAVGVVIFLLTFVVPRLSIVFNGLGDNLPVTTKILLATTGFLTQNGVAITIGLVVAFFAYRAWVATSAGAYTRDKILMNLPMGGPIVKKAVVSRYARVLGTLVNGGVPILQALDLAGMASGNRVFGDTSDAVLQDVKEGVAIATAMKDTGVFPPVLTHMVAIGEETGDLPKMLIRVSDSLDFEVEQGLRRLTSALEPVIVLVMGAIVMFVVLSVLLPIFEAQSLVK